MSAKHFAALDAITFQLLPALEQYAAEVSALVLRWETDQDIERYQQVSRSMDNMRNFCAARPELAVNWVLLLISHTELMHTLWRVSQGTQAVDVKMHMADHAECIKSLSAKCRRLLMQAIPQSH
jgi:hypothetical protein